MKKKEMKENMWNIGYKCDICGTEGTLLEGAKGFDLIDMERKGKKAPCGHLVSDCSVESVWVN